MRSDEIEIVESLFVSLSWQPHEQDPPLQSRSSCRKVSMAWGVLDRSWLLLNFGSARSRRSVRLLEDVYCGDDTLYEYRRLEVRNWMR